MIKKQHTYRYPTKIQAKDLADIKKHQKGFGRRDGPFVKSLDLALASFNVQRQAYYSGSFVGNHIHRALKVRQTVI